MKAVPLYVAERDPDYICMATTWIHQKRREGILEDAQTKKEKPKQEQKQTELWLSPEDLKEFNSYILNQYCQTKNYLTTMRLKGDCCLVL